MSKMTLDQKKLLEPFGKIFADMGQSVRAMSDETLREHLQACYMASMTNCWCCAFDAAQWLQQELRREQHSRKQRAEHLAAV